MGVGGGVFSRDWSNAVYTAKIFEFDPTPTRIQTFALFLKLAKYELQLCKGCLCRKTHALEFGNWCNFEIPTLFF